MPRSLRKKPDKVMKKWKIHHLRLSQMTQMTQMTRVTQMTQVLHLQRSVNFKNLFNLMVTYQKTY